MVVIEGMWCCYTKEYRKSIVDNVENDDGNGFWVVLEGKWSFVICGLGLWTMTFSSSTVDEGFWSFDHSHNLFD